MLRGEIDRSKVAVYNMSMEHRRFPINARCWVIGLHAVVLAAILAVPGSGILCQIYSLFNRTSERPSVTSSQPPAVGHVTGTHLRLASSCHEDHEYRLTAQHRQLLFPKSWEAAVPLQTSTECRGVGGQANIAFLSLAGPAPPFLNQFPSRDPPLTRSRA